jgi:hypothetical protein
MFVRGRTLCGIAATSLALVAAAATSASALTIGSNLQAVPDGGVCATSAAAEASCTYQQLTLPDDHQAIGGLTGREGPTVITAWRVSSGPATPATDSVKLRLRTLRIDSTQLRAGSGTPFVELPLSAPGVHVFAARLPLDPADFVALDAHVIGNGSGEASAPIAHLEGDGAGAVRWSPSLVDGLRAPHPSGSEDVELLLNAVTERDRDGDGYGDKTQDRCPQDPRRHAHCDRTPPRTHLTYRLRQDFLDSGQVAVRLRSSEDALAFASGQIDIAGDRNVVWGIYSARRRVAKGGKVILVLRVPPQAREAAALSYAHGRHVVAKVTVSATDDAGNESGLTVATIRPKR